MTVTAMPKTTGKTSEAEADPEKPKRGKKKVIMLLVVVLAVAGGYWFLRPQPTAEPEPGEVVALEPIQINLAAAHYLRVGIALQLVEGAHEVDGSKALDAAIDEFSGLVMAEVNDPARRAVYKAALVKELHERYHGDVLGVYFTEFVTQ